MAVQIMEPKEHLADDEKVHQQMERQENNRKK